MSALLRRQFNGTARAVLVLRQRSSIVPSRIRGIATTTTEGHESTTSTILPPLTAPSPPKSTFPQPQPLQKISPRIEAVRNAKPFSEFLTDNFKRQHNYLRISITERCNLRCVYCMPEEGVALTPESKLLSTPEILHIANLFVSQGVTKIRLTGGEPTIRKDIIELVAELGKLKSKGLKEIAITSNGLVLARKLDKLVEGGLTAVNLSLDTLEPWKFEVMTRRQGLKNVLKTIDKALELGVQPLKLNCVVMKGVNDYEIPSFVEMTRDKPIEVRFIEYMPFSGNKWNENKMVSYAEMLSQIQTLHPTIEKVLDPTKNETSKTYQIPGFAGKVGFITSMTHNFCGTCNRLRVTGDGNLKVCLFGNEEVSLRDMMRMSDLRKKIVLGGEALSDVQRDVIDKEITEMENQMLDVIGVAVKGKRERHAGIGDLEHMENRPMILIGNPTNVIPPHGTTLFSFPPYSHTSTSIPLHLLYSHKPSPQWHSRFYSTNKPPLTPSSTIATPAAPQLTPRTTITSTSPPLDHPPSTPSPSSTSTSPPQPQPQHPTPSPSKKLTHLTPSGTAHMVPITPKPITSRSATATCTIYFSNSETYPLVHRNELKKGDALSVARIAGITATKLTPMIIPLCHNVVVEGVTVDLEIIPPQGASSAHTSTFTSATPHPHTTNLPNPKKQKKSAPFGGVTIKATVTCEGKTGVEMEALVAVTSAGLTVYDMCKAVDRGMVMDRVRVIEKKGGRSGDWRFVGEEEEEGEEEGRLVNVAEGYGDGDGYKAGSI